MKKIIILISFIVVMVFVSGLNMVDAIIITDPLGDVSIGNPAVATADIISYELNYDTNNLYLMTMFAPGTFDINDYRFVLFLDTDQNPSTGVNPVGIGGTLRTDLGLDFDLRSDTNPSSSSFGSLGIANIFQPGVGVINSIPINFGTDSLSLTIPLINIGNDDGVVNYVIDILDSIKDGFVNNYDIAPNSSLATSSPVPEPTTILLLGSGLIGLVMFRKKFGRK